MCFSPCDPDCLGPFKALWGALSGGAALRRADEWRDKGPICFRDAIFHTHWSEVGRVVLAAAAAADVAAAAAAAAPPPHLSPPLRPAGQVAKLAWALPSRCVGSEILHGFRMQVTSRDLPWPS